MVAVNVVVVNCYSVGDGGCAGSGSCGCGCG